MTSVRIALIGMGKMGRAIALLAPDRDCEVVARIDPGGSEGGVVSRETLHDADVAIEFTMPSAAPANIRACLAAGSPVVVGTTGWYHELAAIRAEVAQANGALLTAPNFSVGVAIFDRVVAEAARLFGAVPGFDAHLIETHHTEKKDAPSGTAASLQRTA